MPGDTLQEFDRLVSAGFNEGQARALVEVAGDAARTDPEVTETLRLVVQHLDSIDGRLNAIDGRLDSVDGRLDAVDVRFDAVDGRLDSIDRRLDTHGQFIEAMLPSVQMIPALSNQVGELSRTVDGLVIDGHATRDRQAKIDADLHVVGERVKMEGRVARMINVALIAIGATVASLLAVFAR